MKTLKSIKRAFTMLELIMVIVILGIVSSIASELIAQVYQSYIIQGAQHHSSLKTELTALQIANRISASIPGTVFRIKTDGTYESVQSPMVSSGDSYKGLQWVGSDMDGFNFYDATDTKVGWSGFCDVQASTSTAISTPGSSLSDVSTIITNLAGGTLPNHSPSLYFAYQPDYHDISSLATDDSIALSGTGATNISEHYKIAWSSYALVIENGDLYLYYHLPPIPQVSLTTAGVKKSLLMRKVSTFKFQGNDGTMRFKICKDELIGQDFNITSCKEKAVF